MLCLTFVSGGILFRTFGPCGKNEHIRNWSPKHMHRMTKASWYHGPHLMFPKGSWYHGQEHTRTSLGPELCLLSCPFKGRDTTDQNIFEDVFGPVISELLMRIITHHTSYTHTHLNSTSQHITERRRFRTGRYWSQNAERYTNYHENSTSVLGPEVSERVVMIAGTMFVIMSVKGSWYHGPEHTRTSLGPAWSTCIAWQKQRDTTDHIWCFRKGRDTTDKNIPEHLWDLNYVCYHVGSRVVIPRTRTSLKTFSGRLSASC